MKNLTVDGHCFPVRLLRFWPEDAMDAVVEEWDED